MITQKRGHAPEQQWAIFGLSGAPWRACSPRSWRVPGRFGQRPIRYISGLWGFGFTALVEAIALTVHFEDMNMVGQAVEDRPGEAL